MIVCGIDEVGRGPLAGPVVAAAVVFEKDFYMEKVKDSKALNEHEREELYYRIIDKCEDFSIGIVESADIDKYNILQSTMIAMRESIMKLKIQPDLYLIDGNYFKLKNNEQDKYNFRTIVKGDSTVFQISCASIIAKVIRDNIMKGFHLRYPEYDFHKHKGYATSLHYSRILKYGISAIHRKSFLKNLLIDQKNLFHELHI